MSSLTPKHIIKELDRYIVGQRAAKRVCAIALRNRWRRKKLPKHVRKEITPKNILIVGPTGVGKTEIARRLAGVVRAPFIKVDATKFTEVGYVGRDVDQIIRDLVDVTMRDMRLAMQNRARREAREMARATIVRKIAGDEAGQTEMDHYFELYDKGKLEDREVEIEVSEKIPTLDGKRSEVAADPIDDRSFISARNVKKVCVVAAKEILLREYAKEILSEGGIAADAIAHVEENGIVFIDEIDKLCVTSRSDTSGVSREGVQRDLIPLLEGSAVHTKYGVVRTDFILFIASGAFYLSKPSDLLPELQGRFPNKIEMDSLSADDFYRILTEPESNLIQQYQALLSAEGVDLRFDDSGIRVIAEMACVLNKRIANIGARRLHTVLEHVLEDLSFEGPDLHGKTIVIDRDYVQKEMRVSEGQQSLTKYVL